MRLQRCMEAVGQLHACSVLLTHFHNHYGCADLSVKVVGVNLIQTKSIHRTISAAARQQPCVVWLVCTVKQQQWPMASMWEDRGSCSRGVGGAALQQEGVAGVADSDRFGRGGQRQLVVGAAVAENLPAVATVVLQKDERVTER